MREGVETVAEMVKRKPSMVIFGSRFKSRRDKHKPPCNGSFLTPGKQFWKQAWLLRRILQLDGQMAQPCPLAQKSLYFVNLDNF